MRFARPYKVHKVHRVHNRLNYPGQLGLYCEGRTLERVPTYSLTAVSTPGETSRALQPLWQQLSIYGVDQDSQMAQHEQIPPGAVYLGIARADHWAVAIPLENDRRFEWLADKNHYPRTAMLESILRFVVSDLATARATVDRALE